MSFWNWLKNLFTRKRDDMKIESKDYSMMPAIKSGDKGDAVKVLQLRLKELGFFGSDIGGNFLTLTENAVKDYQKSNDLFVDGVVGPKTWAALENPGKEDAAKVPEIPSGNQHELNPAYVEAKKYDKKGEKDKGFVVWLSSFWGRVGLKNYKTIIGSSFAWCALFFFTMNSQVGQDVIASAGAKRIGQSGYEINWKAKGMPQGAGVWKNSSSCSSGTGNHITFADGDCTPEDLAKPGATWSGYGGNQSNAVRRSIYCAKGDCKESKDVICRVFWHKKELPSKILKSINCTGTPTNESTR